MKLTPLTIVLTTMICSFSFATDWTPSARWEAIHRAKIVEDENIDHISKRDIFKGPSVSNSFNFAETVVCDWQPKPKNHKGKSRKFFCTLPGEKNTIKVKIPEKNVFKSEVWSEVTATRLFWALGFPADPMYPVKVLCRNCPEDPWKEKGPLADRLFEYANIERKIPGKKTIELFDDQGWSFTEDLPRSSEIYGGATQAQKDALKLLMVLIYNPDTSNRNQRLMCDENSIYKNQNGESNCRKPLMVVQDLGCTFGYLKYLGGFTGIMDLEHWKEIPIWKDPQNCIGALNRYPVTKFKNPKISEAGRKYLADRLSRLTQKQILDIFRYARVEGLGDTPEDWAETFNKKVRQIVDQRCPD